MPAGENCLSGNISPEGVAGAVLSPARGPDACAMSRPVCPIVSFFIVLVVGNVALVPF